MRLSPFFHADWIQSKAFCFDQIGYAPVDDPRAEVVKDFHRSTAKHRIISAPARTSKSYASAPELVHDFFPLLEDRQGKKRPATNENIVFNVAMDYDNCKEWDYEWSSLIDQKLIEQFGGTVEKAHNSPKQGSMLVVATFGRTHDGRIARSVLQTKSSTNEKSLQGEQIRRAILSEAAEHDRRIFEKYLRTRCGGGLFNQVPGSGGLIYPTTPKRKAMWLHKMMEDGETDPSLSVEHFQFHRFCNPLYDHENYWRERRRAELNYGSAEQDPEFMEQFEGVWTFEGGKVLPFRWMEVSGLPSNIVSEMPEWIGAADWFVSCDYGYSDAAVALFWAIAPTGDLCIVSEIYETKLTPSEFARRIKTRTRELGVEPLYYVGDPKRGYVAADLRKLGLPIYKSIRGPNYTCDRAAGFQELREALEIDPDTLRPRLTIYKDCTATIAEWKNLRFKDGYSDEFSKAALVGADHATDAARYGIRSAPDVARGRGEPWHVHWRRHRQRIESYQRRAREREASVLYAPQGAA